MSTEKVREEALRWLETAKEELNTAEYLFTGNFFAKTCFHCQQSAESFFINGVEYKSKDASNSITSTSDITLCA